MPLNPSHSIESADDLSKEAAEILRSMNMDIGEILPNYLSIQERLREEPDLIENSPPNHLTQEMIASAAIVFLEFCLHQSITLPFTLEDIDGSTREEATLTRNEFMNYSYLAEQFQEKVRSFQIRIVK